MCDSKIFRSNSTNKEYQKKFSFDCDSSDAVYLKECRACDVQVVGRTCTPFRNRFNNCKACDRKLYRGSLGIPQAECFRHFTRGAHEGFLKDVIIIIIDNR